MKKKKETQFTTKTDIYTGLLIPKGKLVYTSDGTTNKDSCVRDPYDNNWLSLKSKNTVKDCITTAYIENRTANSVFIGGTIKDKKIGWTIANYDGVLLKYRHIKGINPLNALSAKVALDAGFKEDVFGAYYYDPEVILPITVPPKCRKFSFPIVTKKDAIKYGTKSQTFHISEGKKYTFGVELETSGGAIPPNIANNLNIACVPDGSIRDDNGNKWYGGEYVTGVLQGDIGMKHLYKITNELRKRCVINNTCSIHVHVGGVDFDKRMIVMLWKLSQTLESELYDMMPASRIKREHCRKMKPVKFNFKRKDASTDLLLDAYFEQIFMIVSLGQKPSKTVNKNFNHPAGSHCGYDTSTPRYWWINFVPAMFNLKGKENYTIEMRMHSATLNFTKIKNWILICQAIVYVSENHSKFIMENDNITLKQVIDLAYPLKNKYLNDYIESRKQLFLGSPANSLQEKKEYFIDREMTSVDKSLTETIWD
jgi:hypothetical protein